MLSCSTRWIEVAMLDPFALEKAGKDSDIDLLVVGEVSFEDGVGKISRAQEIQRREINPMVMSLEEFHSRMSKGDHLLDTILKSPFVPVIGDPLRIKPVLRTRPPGTPAG